MYSEETEARAARCLPRPEGLLLLNGTVLPTRALAQCSADKPRAGRSPAVLGTDPAAQRDLARVWKRQAHASSQNVHGNNVQPGADGEAGLRPCLLTGRVPSHANIQTSRKGVREHGGTESAPDPEDNLSRANYKKRLQQTQPRAPTPPPGTRAPPCRKLGQGQSRTGTGHCGKQTPATRPGAHSSHTTALS